jgi:hypothetical protein
MKQKRWRNRATSEKMRKQVSLGQAARVQTGWQWHWDQPLEQSLVARWLRRLC